MSSRYDRAVALVGRAAGALSRLTGRGSGTSLPGRLVRAVDRGFVARRGAALADGSVVVSGTNGKTTTASMIQHILRIEGVPFVANPSGANLQAGVASALLLAPAAARIGVFEVDEAALPSVVSELRPRLLLLTNVFRDQLDRFPEPDRVAGLLRRAAQLLPAGSTLLANVDDPMLWPSIEDLHPVGFSLRGEMGEPEGVDGEPEVCLLCGGELSFARRTMANLGAARCERCGWASPLARYTATLVARAGLEAAVFEVEGETATLPLGGVHNVYNATAAVAAACELGIAPGRAVAALESFQARFGRAEEIPFEGRRLWLGLIKNPAGAGAVVREVAADPRVGAVLVAVSDRDADGRDVSWIWDADFESLVSVEAPMVAAGTRAEDTAVRLKYAGRPPSAVEAEPLAAVRAATVQCPAERIVAVLATYTAMLDIREALMQDRPARVQDDVVEPLT